MDNDNYRRMLSGEPYVSKDELIEMMHRTGALVQKLNRLPMKAGVRRRRLTAKIFQKVGANLVLREGLRIDFGRHTTIGDNCYINYNFTVLDVCPVAIGNRVLIGPNVALYAAKHPLDYLDRREFEFGGPVTIEDDVWIGGSAVVLAGVTIGARSVIGAGAVVTRNIPPDSLALGAPARVVRKLNEEKA